MIIQVIIEVYQGILSDVSLFEHEQDAMKYLTRICEEPIDNIDDFIAWRERHYQDDTEVLWTESILK